MFHFNKKLIFVTLVILGVLFLCNDALAAGRMATSEESARLDSSFNIWKKAWLGKDVTTLVSVYGYEDFQLKNASDKPILHFDEYSFINAVIAREENGEKSAQLFYEVSKSASPDQKMILIINASDKSSLQQPFIGSWQVFPSEYDPQTYTHNDAVKEVDKLVEMYLK